MKANLLRALRPHTIHIFNSENFYKYCLPIKLSYLISLHSNVEMHWVQAHISFHFPHHIKDCFLHNVCLTNILLIHWKMEVVKDVCWGIKLKSHFCLKKTRAGQTVRRRKRKLICQKQASYEAFSFYYSLQLINTNAI